MKTTLIIAAAALAAARLSAAPVDWSKLPPASTKADVTFDKDIAPLFKASCIRCHGQNYPKAQLRLDTLEGVLKGTKQGPILKAGDSANSLLVKSVSQLDPEIAMPPKPRFPRGPRMQGTNAPAMPPQGGPGGAQAGGTPTGGEGEHGAGGPPPGGPGQGPRNFGPPAKPLTAEQVGLVRAWIDQGAK